MAKSKRKLIANKRQQESAKKAMYVIIGVTIALILLVYFVYMSG
ncbi:MAG: hypothetical protein SH848_16185 [Saprospiraceae bacterium]|nr:hypothetical protein [Saprospiraceae bacterium]MDZ4705464.1 hypothetical protein [Saprospiraceae bacterium]